METVSIVDQVAIDDVTSLPLDAAHVVAVADVDEYDAAAADVLTFAVDWIDSFGSIVLLIEVGNSTAVDR